MWGAEGAPSITEYASTPSTVCRCVSPAHLGVECRPAVAHAIALREALPLSGAHPCGSSQQLGVVGRCPSFMPAAQQSHVRLHVCSTNGQTC